MMKYILTTLLALFLFVPSANSYEDTYNFTVVFDVKDITIDEMAELLYELDERFDTQVILQMWGEDFVVYCPSPEECMGLPGTIEVVPNEEEPEGI